MKKALLIIFATLLFGTNIKNNLYLISIGGGVVDVYNSKNSYNARFGYYFYDPNIYKINNRIYADFTYVNSKADFYITNLSLDWIKNNKVFSPFLGVSYGYLYFNQNNIDESTDIIGINIGILANISEKISLEFSSTLSRAIHKRDTWDHNIKNIRANIEIAF